ncbi:metal ABC transporter ATP-binding protein [Pseudogracilibacillus auburnensis]|uniref:Zinc transport system ATP-binding protein n=1 Tax=Pseudogracilibacillus auburnensis TaxID=1494959 RepID=A0A2V3VJC2_9BACI|nr:metal ABC transporter ATP-binding protein [Pseudogracilibacillus auburnensis]MBO1005536.1 metal ABC transporter ATP-binding protein [Pseudogracilibacillus auburnensis]PXW80981.1 zinc transport system ATP-binding protein [Pseudogracilibacillus auburnensis]
MSESVIRLENIHFTYDEKIILSNVNLEIKRGMFMGLVGPNGGGKTTLIQLILGLLKPDQGSIFLLDKPIDKFKDWNRIGFVSQKANTFNKGFPATVYEVVSMGLTAKVGYFKFMKRKDKQKVLTAIDQVGMSEYAYQNIGNLSGGQQQRVFIARALVSDPELLILDEPTVGIDYQNVERFYELLHELNTKQNITLLLVTHDTGAMTKYATNVVCLNQTLHFHGKTDEYSALSAEYLSEIYGHPVQVIVHDHD